ncbi:hypothetical protein N5P32_16855 [Marinomonas pontica]|uniref:hypothetical protein n=1 Tax=Marinomonas pontica TaxID=264739 RepID=UPI00224352EC|nr:hypothetical protein [Marinomonas pontica]MCW8357484.1 hypothetical protein [Marinomonas pontica]
MDFVTLAGLIIAFSSVLLANWLGGGEVILLLNLPSAIIVIVGSIGATLIQSSIQEAIRALVLIKWSLFPPVYDFHSTRASLNNLAHKARRLSLLALESDVEVLGKSFFQSSLTNGN